MSAKVQQADVCPGDMADHRSGLLDPRPVAEVDQAAGTIRLRIGPDITNPVPMQNYTFTRRYPSVTRPRIKVVTLDDGRHQATCHHCDWTLTSSTKAKAEISLNLDYHRNQHRTGSLEVTR